MQATLENRYKVGILFLSLLINLFFLMPFVLLKIEHVAQEAILFFQEEADEADLSQTVLQKEHEELIQHILSSGMVAPDPAQEIQHDQEIQECQMALQSPGAVSLDAEVVSDQECVADELEIKEEVSMILKE